MNWDYYFYNICSAVSENSNCLSRKLGTVITREKYIVSTGYNGPPRGCPHCDDKAYRRYIFDTTNTDNSNSYVKENYDLGMCPKRVINFGSGTGLQYCSSSHAERNAIYTAARLGNAIEGCTLYLNWIIPCFECCKAIINSGIIEVVVTELKDYEKAGITGRKLLEEANIKLREYNFK